MIRRIMVALAAAPVTAAVGAIRSLARTGECRIRRMGRVTPRITTNSAEAAPMAVGTIARAPATQVVNVADHSATVRMVVQPVITALPLSSGCFVYRMCEIPSLQHFPSGRPELVMEPRHVAGQGTAGKGGRDYQSYTCQAGI